MGQVKEFWIKRSEKRVVDQIILYNVQASSEEEAKQFLVEKDYGGEIISELISDEQPYKKDDKIIQIQE